MAGLGIPLEKGTKAYIFRYNPNSMFLVQEVEVLGKASIGQDKEPYYKVRTESEMFGTAEEDDKYPSGKEFTVPEGLVKSRTYVKNVLKKYGKQLVAQIFERMYR